MPDSLLFHKTYTHPSSKEWVVFVHGAGGSSTIWFRQLKAFRKHFNLLLLDLRGHGGSAPLAKKGFLPGRYTFQNVSKDILNVLDHLSIAKAHFVGISLGTILIKNIEELAPERVKSMVLGGAVTRFNFRSAFLVKLGDMFKHIMPYMWLYRLFAFVLMPKKSQSLSRNMFIRDAKKLCQKEFKQWFKLAGDVNPLMKFYRDNATKTPLLYLMGSEDHMFLGPVRDSAAHQPSAMLTEIADSGHVCNVDQANAFNRHSIEFIQQQVSPNEKPEDR
ncbi:alpha/beta fold hydrolase [Thalassotalea sp. PS06]|uniref:alpha/beta fold hydrolase n=1 Tax=Thalassotalea sp. PS06 TaxID=2594005 RepID=UPI0011623521|nr:alpha/beta hydrolase [Thalassotalea sp. PS06]QDP02166.1 alpha/beta fold hydrolase [Thalassotalea sp. PS06]